MERTNLKPSVEYDSKDKYTVYYCDQMKLISLENIEKEWELISLLTSHIYYAFENQETLIAVFLDITSAFNHAFKNDWAQITIKKGSSYRSLQETFPNVNWFAKLPYKNRRHITTIIRMRTDTAPQINICAKSKKGVGTVDAVARLVEEIKEGRKALLLDISNAFNMAWAPVVVQGFERAGVGSGLVRIWWSVLRGRVVPSGRGRCKIGKGCPQGSSLGPTLWLKGIEGWFRSVDRIERMCVKKGGREVTGDNAGDPGLCG
ncbi:hypothetical protein HUJ04_003245 [Dendroctonus ponderosae]|nr:hypothetical protein HUJ04_003245 [Dendroctonus ponderosae]